MVMRWAVPWKSASPCADYILEMRDISVDESEELPQILHPLVQRRTAGPCRPQRCALTGQLLPYACSDDRCKVLGYCLAALPGIGQSRPVHVPCMMPRSCFRQRILVIRSHACLASKC